MWRRVGVLHINPYGARAAGRQHNCGEVAHEQQASSTPANFHIASSGWYPKPMTEFSLRSATAMAIEPGMVRTWVVWTIERSSGDRVRVIRHDLTWTMK